MMRLNKIKYDYKSILGILHKNLKRYFRILNLGLQFFLFENLGFDFTNCIYIYIYIFGNLFHLGCAHKKIKKN